MEPAAEVTAGHQDRLVSNSLFDVVVVGAGPVGQSTALACAKWGLRTLVLEQLEQRSAPGSKSLCQQREVLDTWASLGAGVIAEMGLTWSKGRTYYQDHELFVVDLKDPDRSILPPFVNISQAEVESVLLDLISKNPLIDLRYAVEAVGVGTDEQGAFVEIKGSLGHQVLRSPWVVLCSGVHSDRLRSQLGVEFEGRTFDDLFLICDIRCELDEFKGERRFYFDPPWNRGRQVLIHEQPNGIWRIDWQVPDGFDLASEEETGGVERRIREIVGERPYELLWRSIYRFHGKVASRFRSGAVFLAGDAAHVVAPFGARGLNSGVHDGENLAWKLGLLKAKVAGEKLLDSYDAERRAAALENLEVTSETMRFLVPHGEEERRRRVSLLERARSGDDEAIEQVDSGRLYEPFWYVDSPLTTKRPDRTFKGRPRRGSAPPPVPGVCFPDVALGEEFLPKTRVRELLHDGFSVFGNSMCKSACDRPYVQLLLWSEVDPTQTLRHALRVDDSQAVVVRPDAHIAGFCDSTVEISDVLDQAMGLLQ